MTTITVKKIPEDLYQRLRETAALHRRSINSEIIVCIDHAMRSERVSTEVVLERARRLRARSETGPVPISEVIAARNSGRS